MLETLDQREETMRKVLLHVQAQQPFDKLSFEERRILKECYDKKYFEGLVIDEMISGRIVAEYRHEPRLTLEGLKFLNGENKKSAENSEKSTPDDDKKNNDRLKRTINIFKALVGGLATILTIAGGWPYIKQVLMFLLSLFRQAAQVIRNLF